MSHASNARCGARSCLKHWKLGKLSTLPCLYLFNLLSILSISHLHIRSHSPSLWVSLALSLSLSRSVRISSPCSRLLSGNLPIRLIVLYQSHGPRHSWRDQAPCCKACIAMGPRTFGITSTVAGASAAERLPIANVPSDLPGLGFHVKHWRPKTGIEKSFTIQEQEDWYRKSVSQGSNRCNMRRQGNPFMRQLSEISAPKARRRSSNERLRRQTQAHVPKTHLMGLLCGICRVIGGAQFHCLKSNSPKAQNSSRTRTQCTTGLPEPEVE